MQIAAIPTVPDSGPDDPVWYPVQHALGIDTFGANIFVATRPDQTLVEEHDERNSGQQELYVVLEGEVVFRLDDEEARLDRGTAVAVTDPAVRRSSASLMPVASAARERLPTFSSQRPRRWKRIKRSKDSSPAG